MVYEEKRLMTHKQSNFQTVLVNTVLCKIAPVQSRPRGISKVKVEIKALGTDQTKLGCRQGQSGEGGEAEGKQFLHNAIIYFSIITVHPPPKSFGNVSLQVCNLAAKYQDFK